MQRGNRRVDVIQQCHTTAVSRRRQQFTHTQKIKRRETHFELFSLSLALSWERSSLVLQPTERRRRRQKRKWKSITVVVVVAPARSFLHVQDSRGRDAKEGGHCLPRVWIFFFYTRETTTTTTSTMLCYIDYGRAWNMRRTPKTWRHNPPPCFFLLFLSRNNNNDEDIFNIYFFFFFNFLCVLSPAVCCACRVIEGHGRPIMLSRRSGTAPIKSLHFLLLIYKIEINRKNRKLFFFLCVCVCVCLLFIPEMR